MREVCSGSSTSQADWIWPFGFGSVSATGRRGVVHSSSSQLPGSWLVNPESVAEETLVSVGITHCAADALMFCESEELLWDSLCCWNTRNVWEWRSAAGGTVVWWVPLDHAGLLKVVFTGHTRSYIHITLYRVFFLWLLYFLNCKMFIISAIETLRDNRTVIFYWKPKILAKMHFFCVYFRRWRSLKTNLYFGC